MRSNSSKLFGAGLAGLIGVCVVVGCSADGDTDLVPEADSGLAPETGPTFPEAGPSDDADTPDPGPTDAGKPDATKPDGGDGGAKPDAGDAGDAGPVGPTAGETCATPNEIFEAQCGKCGKKSAVCLASGDDAGTGTWSDYGACGGETGACLPGDTQACGNCGTQTCTNSCKWGTCTGQPKDSCPPGTVDLTTAGCSAPNTYRSRTCTAACTWGNYAGTCVAPPTYLTVPPSVGGVDKTLIEFKATQIVERLYGLSTNCPSTSAISSTKTPYVYTELRNTNATPMKVAIYHTKAPGGAVIDTLITAYTAIPTTDAERKACVRRIGDTGTAALVVDTSFASVDGTYGITIPAGATYYVFSYAYNDDDFGLLNVNVKTEAVNP